ncbi:MAG: hypothetical protein Q7S59_08375, partial [Sulfurimonas sp.]|nr:hypothetical protein [Sulfurimonas sp.]
MLKHISKKLSLLAITLVFIEMFSGCAIRNEGKVDFRRTNTSLSLIENSSTNELVKCNTEQSSFLELTVKNVSLRKDKDTRFMVGDSLSLHLRSAYIADFSELISPREMFTRQRGKAIGEIAIVANAFEETNGNELSFEDTRAGRVVFYSDDVNKGQFLNFNNMPIYGPLNYIGSPFAFRIAIFELDTESKQSKMMLNTIAQAGSTAYPPSSPVLKILNGIGESLLSGDQTDTEFRYTMVLDSKSGSNKTNHFTLEVGNYIFVRMEDRTKNVNWDELFFDENEAKLYWKDKYVGEKIALPYDANTKTVSIDKRDVKHLCNEDINCSKSSSKKRQEYTDGTYIVVEITKNVSNIGVELAQNNFGNLIATLEEKDRKNAANFQSIKDSLTYAAVKRSQIYNFHKAKEILSSLENNTTVVAQKKADVKELLEMISDSVDENGTAKYINISSTTQNVKLSKDEIDYVMSKL